jgi:hypothetical protein
MVDMRKVLLVYTSLLLASLAFGSANSILHAQGQTNSQATVHITSPLQNQIFTSNNILVNFTCETTVPNAEMTDLLFKGNLDGQLGYHGGSLLSLGRFQTPIQNFYSIPVNVSEGSHLLWVQVDIWYQSKNVSNNHVESLSQIVGFTVDKEATVPTLTSNPTENPTQILTNTPTSTIPPTPSPKILELTLTGAISLLVVVAGVIVLIYLKRSKSKTD